MSYPRSYSGQTRAARQRETTFKTLLFIVIALLLCGAPFAAFSIFETARDAVLTYGSPNLGGIPSINLPLKSARVASGPNIGAGERVNVLVLGIDRRPSEK